MSSTTSSPPSLSRATPDEVRTRMLVILSDGRIDDEALNDVRARAGLDDPWPPKDPRHLALGLLDPDEGPDPDGVQPSAVFDLADALLDLTEHNAFEAGKASAGERAAEAE